jgi:Family of unknown function (DUF5703)
VVTLVSMSEPTLRPAPPIPGNLPVGAGDYEYRVLNLPRSLSRGRVRAMLTELAEQGHWELAFVRLHEGGSRRVWLRRRIIRVVRTG